MLRLRTELRLLRAYTALSAAGFVVLAFAAFHRDRSETFDVVTAHRINIVEPNGTMRLLISDRALFPQDLEVNGKTFHHPRPVAGMLFFNDEGQENGGLTWAGHRQGNGYSASGTLTFDRYQQDQVVGVRYVDANDRRTAGFSVWDRPARPISELIEGLMRARALPAGPRQDSAMHALEAGAGAGRLFAGRDDSGAALVRLQDGAGRARLRLVVDSAGAARIEFLDSLGKVTRTLP